jgi:hypothetical protein
MNWGFISQKTAFLIVAAVEILNITHGNVKVYIYTFLNLAADGDQWPASCPGLIIPRGNSPW